MQLVFVYPNKSQQEQRLGLNASMRYRAYHPLLYLGWFNQVHFITLEQLGVHLNQNKVTGVIFIRPFYSQLLARCLDKLRSLSIPVQADFDDLLFLPEITASMPRADSASKRAKIYSDAKHYQQALLCFDFITTSTAQLAVQVENVHPKAHVGVFRNLLSPEAGYFQPRPVRPDKTLSLYYFSGTQSHSKDLACIIPALADWLSASNHHQLVLVGAIDIPKALKEDQVKRLRHVHYLELPYVSGDALAAIAPLEDTPFNQCKSAIKYLETAHLGIPVVCSACGEYARIDQVQGPLLAQNQAEWFDTLMLLSTDAQFWQQESTRQQQGALCYGKTQTTNPFLWNQDGH